MLPLLKITTISEEFPENSENNGVNDLFANLLLKIVKQYSCQIRCWQRITILFKHQLF
jgi:hypothetical protein